MTQVGIICRRFLHFFLFLLPALLALCLLWGCTASQPFADFYTTQIFPSLAAPIALITSLFPVSLTELLCILAIPGIFILLACFIVRTVRSKNKGRTIKKAVRFCGWLFSWAFLLYMLFHGLNFYRQPLWNALNYANTPKTPQQLSAVCTDLAQRASALRESLEEDENGVLKLPDGISATLAQSRQIVAAAKEKLNFLEGYSVRPKGVMLSHWWSYTGITGMYFPFFVESNINTDVVDHTIPHTICHEVAHTYGYAREDEANFIGYLLCISSNSPAFQYSGYLAAYNWCANALYQYDPEEWKKCFEWVSDGMRRDLQAQSRYWDQFQGEVMQASTAVNDTFLKAQNQSDGVLSYDRAVALVLAQYEKEGFF